MLSPVRRVAVLLLASVAGLAAFAATKPVEFAFTPPSDQTAANPFARELWADVIAPSGKKIRLPVFYAGDGRFAVRARPEEIGTYRLGDVTDTTGGKAAAVVPLPPETPRQFDCHAQSPRSAIQRDPRHPASLVDAQGVLFVPVGANLAWAPANTLDFYLHAIPAFAHADLNWMRVWMAHWGWLNLDWLPPNGGPSPAPGTLDLRVAATWDRLLDTAEEQGVYLQIVLQHHGQYATGSNPNWAENPWNAAHPGGFLRTPAEFFTSPEARRLTALKYRYIVARWGWSPAVFAWELFNEVHWVDAMSKVKDEAAVAAWHGAMADVLRAADVYRHLITTSTENLRSPIYDKLDFYQPHLYAADLITGARLTATPAAADRPVFYGEVGDDHLPVSAATKESGVTIVAAVWASLMGQATLPAQPWEGWQLLARGRLDELGAVHRFVTGSGLYAQPGLTPFSAVVESATRVPLQVLASQVWQRRPGPEFDLPLDGREPLELADVPAFYVGPASVADGFPGRVTFHVDYPRDATLRVHVGGYGRNGATLRVSVDGQVAAEQHGPDPALPTELAIPIPAGRHRVVVENSGGPDWVGVPEIDLGLDTSVLAAIGRRSDSFIALWLRHRANLYATEPVTPAEGTLMIEAVPAGRWQVVWWDTFQGVPAAPISVEHPGGTLRLPVPPIRRHAAVVLTAVGAGK